MSRKIRWTSEVTTSRGVVEVDDDASESDIWETVDEEARQYLSTDWKDADDA